MLSWEDIVLQEWMLEKIKYAFTVLVDIYWNYINMILGLNYKDAYASLKDTRRGNNILLVNPRILTPTIHPNIFADQACKHGTMTPWWKSLPPAEQ